MEELTEQEKELIINALNIMFQAKAFSGSLDAIEIAVKLARSIERKLRNQAKESQLE